MTDKEQERYDDLDTEITDIEESISELENAQYSLEYHID